MFYMTDVRRVQSLKRDALQNAIELTFANRYGNEFTVSDTQAAMEVEATTYYARIMTNTWTHNGV